MRGTARGRRASAAQEPRRPALRGRPSPAYGPASGVRRQQPLAVSAEECGGRRERSPIKARLRRVSQAGRAEPRHAWIFLSAGIPASEIVETRLSALGDVERLVAQPIERQKLS